MSILVGAHPGGRNSFAVCALYWTGRLPAMLVGTRSYSGVNAVLHDIMGVFGEWGELTAAAIDAPLSWSGTANGWRQSDAELKALLPSWVPNAWLRASNALPGAVGVQGPALTWAMAKETKLGGLPEHRVFETHPRISMARTFRDLQEPILGYRKRDTSAALQRKHRAILLDRIVDTGMVKLEVGAPDSADQIDALMCALTAIAASAPDTGMVTRTLTGGDIRPVGNREIIVLDALP